MKQKLMMVLFALFVGVNLTQAQTTVSGTVIDAEFGEPIIGATVKIVGTNQGTATDLDGKFTLKVAIGTKLQVSYMGMEPQIVPAKQKMTIRLQSDDKVLEEVIVTGYGSARKLGTIAGSVATVSSKDIENRPIANVGDAMQGQVAGLQVFTSSGEPSATTSMRIRGMTSLYASTEPLFILDGSEISQQTFLSLNPNDVESITVLKDASSTAIYGSRAANGVVIITSKKGKLGDNPTITLSVMYGLSQMSGDHEDMMNATQWLDFQELIDPTNRTNPAFQAKKNFYNKYGISTDWTDIFFGDNKPTAELNVSIRGGSERMAYLVSYGHYTAQGIMDDSDMRRETMRINLEGSITDWLKIGTNTNLAYTKSSATAFGTSANSVYNKAHAARIYLPTQTYNKILGLEGSDFANATFNGFGERLTFFDQLGYYNPYWVSEIQPGHNTRVRLNENLFVNVSPIQGLNVRSAVGLDANDVRSTSKTYNTLDIDPEVFPTGSASESFSRFYRWTVTNTAEYKFDIYKKHLFTVLLGQETMTNKTEAFSVSVNGLTDNRLLLMSSGTQSNVSVPGHAISEEVRNSYFGMLNYSFNDRYYVDLSIRRDGSSLFAKGHRWATFGAGAFMWDITNEKFMKSSRKWLNSLQAKVSYGSTGNSGISAYQALGLVSSGPEYGGMAGIAPSNVANDELSWETVKTFNVGLSAKFINRITFELEYYNKVTSDMLVNVPYSYTTGFSSQWANVAEMYNRGVDFNIGADIIKQNDWYWNVRLNGNFNKNKITKLFNGTTSYDVTNLVHLEEGHPYGELYQVRWSHVDPIDGQNVWIDKDGNFTKTFSESDRVMTGKNVIAPWSGGLSTTVSWKGIQLDVQFTGMFGRYMMNNERYFIENPEFATKGNQTTDMLNIWQKPGDVTRIAAVNSERHFDTGLIENASFVRLKFLQLSYNFPKKLLASTKCIKDAKVFFVGRNLLTFTKYKGYDPEIDSFSSIGEYPNTRQYSIGLQVTF